MPYAEMFGTFALSVGAAVSFLDWKLTTTIVQLYIYSLNCSGGNGVLGEMGT